MEIVKKTEFYTKISNIEKEEVKDLYKFLRLSSKENLPQNVLWAKFFSDGCIQILTSNFKLKTYNDFLDNKLMVTRLTKDVKKITDLS